MRKHRQRASAVARARSLSLLVAALLVPAGILPPAPAFAQAASARVSGTIAAIDGTPIAGATITLQSQKQTVTATSDAGGHFTMSAGTTGTYSVFASAPGYAPLSQRTITFDAAGATLSLVLSRATTNSLTVIGQVVSSASESVSTSSAPSVTINAQAAAAAGETSVAQSVWTQLATTPVLPLGGGSNATVSFALRGPDPTETLVDIDGHQVNNGNTGDFDLSLIDPAALQDVQLVYGISPSSLVGPDTLGGAINIQTLQPTTTPQAFIRAFGGSFGSFGETIQATGSSGLFGYAFSLHRATSSGSVNQSVLALPDAGTPVHVKDLADQTIQSVGDGYFGQSAIAKLRYQLGGSNGYGYVQVDYRGSNVNKDESALLTTYFPPGSANDNGPDALQLDGALHPDALVNGGFYQSFAGTGLASYQANYGLDAQIPLGDQKTNGTPATVLQVSHLTTLASQTVSGPGLDTLPYLYDQRDLLGDDWLQIDHAFSKGLLSFKYDLGTEQLDTDYVQGQVTAQVVSSPFAPAFAADDDASPTNQVQSIAQTTRSAVLRYNGDPTAQIHYSLALYSSDYSIFGHSFDPRAGFVWTPTGTTAVRASVGTTFQAPQLSELVVPPPSSRVPVGGVIYIGNPNLQPDHGTEYDLGAEHIFGRPGRQLHLSADVYQSNLRATSNQLNVIGVPGCGKPANPCPISYPVNAGDGIYSGIEIRAEQQLGNTFRIRAGWDEDSSYVTTVPANIQDGTIVINQQSLGQPLHKAYLGFENAALRGLQYGAQLNYEGTYNELNQGPYATLDAHLAYRTGGYQLGLYGTNLTNTYAQPFTVYGAGIVYGTVPTPGNLPINEPAYILQGRKVVFVVTRSL